MEHDLQLFSPGMPPQPPFRLARLVIEGGNHHVPPPSDLADQAVIKGEPVGVIQVQCSIESTPAVIACRIPVLAYHLIEMPVRPAGSL
ncbi:hypothetical protein AB0C34_17140 [Nocardia sp. NPDC049220]|uniref:hypothetical protein n=1 Tax=Nocardia sp. NPDC049220 TaxID=3155273 RepID=UPI0033D58249